MSSRLVDHPLVGPLLEFAFPTLCLGCGEQTDSTIQVCDRCFSGIDRYTEPFCLTCKRQLFDRPDCPDCKSDSWLLFPYGNYVDPLKEIVISFKFRSLTGAADFAVEGICEQFSERIFSLEPTWLVPIPLYPMRQLIRGYNQAEILADKLGERLNLPVASDFLVRKKRRREQARLSEHERPANVHGVFEAMADADPGERVILVDDVVTSGATVAEARRILIEAGFDVPGCISLAHGL
ncbi:MAG: ComF family protein [bacterium]|nr:ComF family protein [bacterium]